MLRKVLRKARLFREINGRVECNVCIRFCKLKPGQRGFCGNYANVDGDLYNIGYGLISAIESRPIEIKPLFHFWPGSTAATFSGWGCNLLCPWCQNWSLSKRKPEPNEDEYVPPERIVEYALRWNDQGVCASFNEPVVFTDYLLDVFELAKKRGLYNTMVSNGTASRRTLRALRDAGLDAMNIDIKGCPRTYRKFIGLPDPEEILKNAKYALDLGIHVEMVFLVVTGANDDFECMKWVIDKHLDYMGEDVPIHINRYHPAYEYMEPPTSMRKLMEAHDYAVKSGLKYVYLGNIADASYMNTKCPNCGKVVIRRTSYATIECRVNRNGRCSFCGYKLNIIGPCAKTPVSKVFI